MAGPWVGKGGEGGVGGDSSMKCPEVYVRVMKNALGQKSCPY